MKPLKILCYNNVIITIKDISRMQLKIHNFIRNKLGLFLPVLVLLGAISAVVLSILIGSARPALAGPTPGNPISISTTVDHPSLNLQFNQSELASSAFKQVPVTTTITTNNPTGFTFYVSSIDEDTNLNHSDSAISEKITSISSPLISSHLFCLRRQILGLFTRRY